MTLDRVGGAAPGAPPGAEPNGPGVVELLEGMRRGDRETAALFVTRYGARIRRRIRGKLSPAMRRIFDSQDILSTLGRRLDRFVRSGRFAAANEGELWALLLHMADHAIVEKARVFRHLDELEGGERAFAMHHALRDGREDHRADAVDIDVGSVLGLIEDRTDREILSLWLIGATHRVIAGDVGLAPTAVRKRLQKIRRELQRKLGGEAPS